MPWYICIGVLTALLIWREIVHNRTTKGLLDRILMNEGLEPLPESHPLAEAIREFREPALAEQKQEPSKVRLAIPGMDAFRAMQRRAK
jgi:hypothetical protein